MTIDLGIDVLHHARRNNKGLVAAVAYDTVGLEAIVIAAERADAPIILQVGSSAFGRFNRNLLVAAAKAAAESSLAQVGLHLDHAHSLDEIRRALDDGYSSVMIDGSKLPFEDNVNLTAAAVELGHGYGVWVEGELGRLSGDEDRSERSESGSQLTSPEEAARFVSETGVDALAVCIGNVHGRTNVPVSLDFGLLSRIANSVEVPLVLHGSSGISKHDLVRCAQNGVAKFNINADLRTRYIEEFVAQASDPATLDDLSTVLVRVRDELVGILDELIVALRSDL